MIIGDRYEVTRELGQGAFGTTYAALDRTTGRDVAVKILDLGRIDDWKAVELFEREAAVLKTLDHPGIPAYVEFRPLEVDKQAFLVQSLARGENLEQLMKQRRFTEADLQALAERVLEILAYLTTVHPIVVHRDVKPGNIVLADDGAVSLVDFGAVRAIAESSSGTPTVAGTFGYMAPEQLQGLATPTSDLYGLGMTLVHLATGREPSELPVKRLKPEWKPHAELSRDLETFVDRLIEPVPDDRFASATAALAALRALRRDEGRAQRDESRAQRDENRAQRDENRAQHEVPSADEVNALAAKSAAAVQRREEAAAARKARKSRKRKSVDRVTFVEEADGATLTIRPEPGWRGREIHLGLLSVPMLVALLMGPAMAGILGFVVAFAACAGLVALILFTAPTWHLRVVRGGNFVLYARTPKHPHAAGHGTDLHLTTTPTARGGLMVTLHYLPTARGITLYPLGASDVSALKRAAKLGNFKVNQVN